MLDPERTICVRAIIEFGWDAVTEGSVTFMLPIRLTGEHEMLAL